MTDISLETDLNHLEQLVSRLALGDGVPFSYWRKRLEFLTEYGELLSSERRQLRSIVARILMLESKCSNDVLPQKSLARPCP